MYILALLLPFLAVILSGRVIAGLVLFGLQLTIVGWPVAVVVAWLIINDKKQDKRFNKLMESRDVQ